MSKVFKRDMTVRLLRVLDVYAQSLPRKAEIQKTITQLEHEISVQENPTPVVIVEGEDRVGHLEAIDIIGDLLEVLESPKDYLESTLKQYSEDEESIEELVERLADYIASGAGFSEWWLDKARNEIRTKIPPLLH